MERQIDWLKTQGITEVTILIGYLGNVIADYFGNGTNYGISIQYINEDEPLGTAGGLFFYRPDNDDPILLINGDIVFDIDLEKMLEFHKKHESDITLLTHPNNHPYDSALIETNDEGRVIKWLNKEDARQDYKNRVNAGIHLLEQKTIQSIHNMDKPQKIDLDRIIIKPNIGKYRIFAYDSPEYVKDMGTPDRYYAVCRDYQNGLIERKNLQKKQKAVFLDRDGTINKLKDFITQSDEIELLEGAAEAVEKINQSGYLAILITNQPVIARGECSIEELRHIHNRLERLLGEKHAYLDDIFFCPHHPDKGFEGERPEYKIVCECRKPKPGLIYRAAELYHIDLTNSYMIGDHKNDIQAGIAAGCKTGYINTDAIPDLDIHADYYGSSLIEIVERILYDNNESSI